MNLEHMDDQDQFAVNFGRRLRSARQFKGMNRRDLAARLGIHKNTLLNWESAASIPSAFHYRRAVAFIKRVEAAQ